MIGSTSVDLPPPESGREFESLVADLFEAQFDTETFLHGRSGQSDDGVDIYFKSDTGAWVGVQCKNTQTLTETTIGGEVTKADSFEPSLDRYIIATTLPQDKHLQETVRKLSDAHETDSFSIELRMWNDISRLLQRHDTIFERYYGDYFTQATATLHAEGGVELSEDYLTQHRPRSPKTAWQAELTLSEVHAGYAVDRVGEYETPVHQRLYTRIEAGEHLVIVGEPGDGKSVLTKQLAVQAFEADRAVLYCGDTMPLGDVLPDIRKWISDHPSGLVVLEEMGTSERSDAYDIAKLAESYESLGFIGAIRSSDWHDGATSPLEIEATPKPDSLEPIAVPELTHQDVAAAIERYEDITETAVDVAPKALFTRVTVDPTGGSILSLIHLISLYGDTERGAELSPREATILDTSVKTAISSFESEIERVVAIQATVLKIAGIRPHKEFCFALTSQGFQPNTIETAISSLTGSLLFASDTRAFTTKHELWCVRFLEHLLQKDRSTAIREFEQCINAVFRLCDDTDLRLSINTQLRTQVFPTEFDVEQTAAHFVFRLFQPGQQYNSLVDYYGESKFSRIELPASAPEWARMHQYVWRGVMAISRGGSAEGVEDLLWAQREYEKLLTEIDADETIPEKGANDFRSLALTNLSLVKRNRGEIEAAKHDLERALELSSTDELQYSDQTVYANLARMYLHLGEQDDAETAFRMAIRICRQYGDHRGWAKGLGGLAVIFFDRGDTERAKACNETAQRVFEEIGDLESLAYGYSRLASQLEAKGDIRGAIRLQNLSLEINRNQGNEEEVASDLMTLGSIAIQHERPDKAREYTRKARARFSRAGNKRAVAQCDGNLANIALQEGNPQVAEREQQAVIRRLEDLEDSVAVARARADLANVYLHQGQFEKATHLLRKAGEQLASLGETRSAWKVMFNAGQLLYHQNHEKAAGALFGTAMLQQLAAGSYMLALNALDHFVEIHLNRQNLRQATTLALQGWMIANREGIDRWESQFLFRYHLAIRSICPAVHDLLYRDCYTLLRSFQPAQSDFITYLEETAQGDHT